MCLACIRCVLLIYIYIYVYSLHFSGGASSSRVSGAPALALPEKCEKVKPFMQTNARGVGGGGTPIHYLYGYVPPKGVVILKLLISNGVSISEAFSRTGYKISNARKFHFCKQPFESIQGQIAFKNTVQCVNKQTVVLLLHPRTEYKKLAHF